MISIGFLGTAKNTGKTTALSMVMSEATARGYTFCVTSIGYDGEDQDTLTGLPKPRISPPVGSLVLTAERCAHESAAGLRLVRPTSAVTPLGRVCLYEVLETGRVATAGPNKKSDLRHCLTVLEEIGPSLVFVDGAFSRVSPMSEVTSVVISTGAARSLAPEVIAEEALSLESILSIDKAPLSTELVSFSGVATASAIGKWQDANILVDSPVAFLADHQPIEICRELQRAYVRNVRVFCKKPLKLAAVTINPTYPHETSKGEYRYHSISDGPILHALSHVRVPVINVMRDGASLLLDSILGLCGKPA